MATPTYESKTIEHLGLVAGMIDELGITDVIDSLIPQDTEQRHVTIGQAVKAMILNGLGFTNRRLYLTPHFFRGKPTERLLGEGIQPEHLNDDTLGSALDRLHAFGVTELFSVIARGAVTKLGLSARIAHLDTSSFHVDGRGNEAEDEGVIHVTRGYSRDHRPDLNQVILELMAENQAGIPTLMRPLSGNRSDKTSFQEVVTRHIGHLQTAGIEVLVTDSSGFTPATLEALDETDVTWVMSVPATITQAKDLREGVVDSGVASVQRLSRGCGGESSTMSHETAPRLARLQHRPDPHHRHRRRGARPPERPSGTLSIMRRAFLENAQLPDPGSC